MNINGEFFYIGVSIYNSKNKEGNKKLVGDIGKAVYENIRISTIKGE